MNDEANAMINAKDAALGSENTKPLVSVVIVSYLNVEFVQACLDSLQQYNDLGRLAEVVVVDNSPNHEVVHSLSSVYSRARTPVQFLVNDNRGFGQGNNVGVSRTAGEFILLLNPDTELTEPLFSFVVDAFRDDPSLGVFGIQHRGKAGHRRMSFYWIDRAGVTAAILIKLANWFGVYRKRTMFTSGAALFLRRTAFIVAGGFDEAMFLYNEERDLFRRIHRAGYTSGFFGDRSLIHHEGNGTPPSISSLRYRLNSLQHYCTKYGLDYVSFLRADLRVATFGYLIRLVRRSPDAAHAKARVLHLRSVIRMEALKRERASGNR